MLAGRADQFDRVFDAADQRIAARIDQTTNSLCRPRHRDRPVFEDAHERIIDGTRAASDALSSRAVELGDVFKGADEQLADRV